MSWTSKARVWRSILPARPRWWRFTMPARACGTENSRWRWRGGGTFPSPPFPFIGFSKASMLAPDGRGRAFDADGKGYVRAEGGALLFLKPLRKAKAD